MMFLTAIIWGFAFVAQKSSMDVMGPYTFNTIRFVLGPTCLLLLLPFIKSTSGRLGRTGWLYAVCMGFILFLGSISQQIGIVSTTAGKAAFITGLYIVVVPLLMSLLGRSLSRLIWVAVLLAIIGLFLLSVPKGLAAMPVMGDYWVLASAVFFAMHIVIIGFATVNHDALRLSIIQFYVCAFLSAMGMFNLEMPTITAIKSGGFELLYAGLLSVGVAYTLQVFAQKRVSAHSAALVLSLEAVFGAIGGIWLLDEQVTLRIMAGALLMLIAIIVAQIPEMKRVNA